jgi:hypothetical protein
MGLITDPPASAVIREAREYKEQSLNNPAGVQFMDHLWGVVMNCGPLTPVLRTDDDLFDDVPVRAWWIHGWYSFESPDRPEHSELVFDVPDEVWRRVQSRYASQVMYDLFGQSTTVELAKPFRKSTDEVRHHTGFSGHGGDFTSDVVTDDWEKLRAAIELMARDAGGRLGGQSVSLYCDGAYTAVGLARVVETRLEIHIGDVLGRIIGDWQTAFRTAIAVSEPRW